jgi:hypothetical protein
VSFLTTHLHHHHECILPQHTGLVDDITAGALVRRALVRLLAAAAPAVIVSQHNGSPEAV